MAKVVLIGPPNVGKSIIFNYLTGRYVTVSNYPGTTVEIARGYSKLKGITYEVIDTPGIYSLLPITEEERVTRELLCREKADIIIHVIDGKNIRRMLNLTVQLIEAGLPVLLVVNLMDEAQEYGISIDTAVLANVLGIPVIATAAINGSGLATLKQEIAQYRHVKSNFMMNFSAEIEQAVVSITSQLQSEYAFAPRMVALLLLQGDEWLLRQVENPCLLAKMRMKGITGGYHNSLEYMITIERQAQVDRICNGILHCRQQHQHSYMEQLGRVTREPLTGIPILCIVLFLGLYQFVGRFGAGFLVNYLDSMIFMQYINPTVEQWIHQWISWEWLQSLIVGEYGIFSLGLRYAVVIILPIVGSFFLMFAILEDSGYLPRLAMLVDRILRMVSLNGRAVIPLALAFGCGTMAVMVTRTLETRRERMLATFLLSLAIPCSAQLGVIMALLSSSALALIIWSMYIGLIFIVIGWLSGNVMPGRPSAFYMEIPPLRVPKLSNVITKASMRMWCYFVEILPIFIITSIVLWGGERSGLLAVVIDKVEPIMTLVGLPVATAQVFLLGFFRRDYGAAGLYDMCARQSITLEQLLIASVILTLFVPCIAQVAVMIKERGAATALLMLLMIICIAIAAGWGLSYVLHYGNLTI